MTDSSGDHDHVDILVVDPNPDDADLLRESFTDANIANDLHIVTDGDEALEFVHQRDDHADSPRPDLVLLDLQLDGTSGEDVLRELKGGSDLEQIPVIVMTNSDDEERIARSYDLHANAYVQKPVEADAFIDAVRSLQDFWLRIAHLPSGTEDESETESFD